MNLTPASAKMRQIHTMRLAGEDTKQAEKELSDLCDSILLQWHDEHKFVVVGAMGCKQFEREGGCK